MRVQQHLQPRIRIGPSGRLVGIEPCLDMLTQAGERADRLGWSNVDLRLGLPEDQMRPDDDLDAALFCFGRLRPGGRAAAVGPMWAPWWAPAMNLLVWYVASDYVTTFEGFSEPWSHLADLVPGLEVERHDLAGEYFAWGEMTGNRP